MKHILTSDSMRECDRYTIDTIGIPSLVLMEKAALAICHCCEKYALQKLKRFPWQIKITAVCGPGNNGGDGVAAVRILKERGFNAGIFFTGDREKTSAECQKQLEIAENLGLPFFSAADLPGSDIIIDAIFGIGLTRNVEGVFAEVIGKINESPAYKISADISSGINADTGAVMGCAVKANETAVIENLKPGHLFYPGAGYAGLLTLGKIGIKDIYAREKGMYLLEGIDIAGIVPGRRADGNKGTFGKVLVVAGNRDMPGAARFSCLAAMRSGAGMVKLITHRENKTPVAEAVPEAMLALYDDDSEAQDILKNNLSWADVIVIGPGLGVSDVTFSLVKTVLTDTELPVIIDADGLNVLQGKTELLNGRKDCFITPHVGEMSRLTGIPAETIKADPAGIAAKFASEHNVQCILKDARSVTATVSGNLFVNRGGNSGMATAGSGDVLTGVLAALIGRGTPAEYAGACACYIHSMSGDAAAKARGESNMIASDIIDELKNTFERLRI